MLPDKHDHLLQREERSNRIYGYAGNKLIIKGLCEFELARPMSHVLPF